MKRLILLLLLFIYLKSEGHQDLRIERQYKNITIIGFHPEKAGLLFELVDKMNQEYFNDTASIQIIIPYPISYSNKKYYTLKYNIGYTQTSSRYKWDNNKGVVTAKRNIKRNTVMFYGEPTYDFAVYLKLIYYALKHPEEIKKQQKKVLAYQYPDADDSINIVPQETISKILKGEYPEINKLFTYRMYRHWYLLSDIGNIDYYYQNYQYHVYKIDHKREQSNGDYSLKKLTSMRNDTSGKFLFSFNQIDEIATDSSDNYLIFTGSDTFYHLQLDLEKLNGPFILPRIKLSHYNPSNFYEPLTLNKNGDIVIPDHIAEEPYNIIYDIKQQKARIDSMSFSEQLQQLIKEDKL